MRLARRGLGGRVVALVIGDDRRRRGVPHDHPGCPTPAWSSGGVCRCRKLLMDSAGAVTVGLLLVAALLLPSDKGVLGKSALGYVRPPVGGAGVGGCRASSPSSSGRRLHRQDRSPDPRAHHPRPATPPRGEQGVALTLVVLFGVAIAVLARGHHGRGRRRAAGVRARHAAARPAHRPHLLLAQPRPGHLRRSRCTCFRSPCGWAGWPCWPCTRVRGAPRLDRGRRQVLPDGRCGAGCRGWACPGCSAP